MKVMTVLGTRPEIIRLTLVIGFLDQFTDHTLVHTGQNFDDRLDGLFFRELGIRAPNVNLNIRGKNFGDQAGQILARVDDLLLEHRPDRVLVLGDTNSGLASIVARRRGIPVYHMEAGNRCYDDRVPEEVNRRIIDHSSSVLLPYTNRSRDNLLREGIPADRIYVTGNPIKQVLDHFAQEVDSSHALTNAAVDAGRYFLVTMHRAENVDREGKLRELVKGLESLHRDYGFPVICSLHPRTASRIEAFGIDVASSGLRFTKPLGFFDFVALEKKAFCVLSDSGTVQEECCIFSVPNVTIREVTERPETLESGSNFLAGSDASSIQLGVRFATTNARNWAPPPEYLAPNVAQTVMRILTGFRVADLAETEWQHGLRN